MWLRLKPLAIFCSIVAPSSKSPATCSTVNWSKGKLRLNASMTQSRQWRHIAAIVDVIAVGVGEARGIEPIDAPAARR